MESSLHATAGSNGTGQRIPAPRAASGPATSSGGTPPPADPASTEALLPLLRTEVVRLVEAEASSAVTQTLLTPQRLRAICELATEDLLALARRDPAAGNSWQYVWDSYVAYRATLAYRVAHAVHRAEDTPLGPDVRLALARRVSEAAKVRTGVEIHPAASIGRRLVIDHGLGTVVGETTEIGDDAYILQGVVLGARGIADNPSGRRHPRLGDRVEVGAFARILGAVTVGDDVLIGPGIIVTNDVPSHRRVRLLNQYQGTSGECNVRVFGVVPVCEGVVEVHGTGLASIEVDLVTSTGQHRPVVVLERDDRRVRCAVNRPGTDERLRIIDTCGNETVLYNLQQLWRALDEFGFA
ncbi:serine O-acetyltransferase [Micromonospora sp. WMMD734]|uniref:Serine acetyltransferase n=1 Tax=Micromonospora humidisoli TaxID=2807622 RepID=A0ABS2J392_9ACTN|nr:serine O-acetyltransferase [Micromonospora humidisoli]MBM7081038.1 serine acetyltransferase [Micromonospora humidisoli]